MAPKKASAARGGSQRHPRRARLDRRSVVHFEARLRPHRLVPGHRPGHCVRLPSWRRLRRREDRPGPFQNRRRSRVGRRRSGRPWLACRSPHRGRKRPSENLVGAGALVHRAGFSGGRLAGDRSHARQLRHLLGRRSVRRQWSARRRAAAGSSGPPLQDHCDSQRNDGAGNPRLGLENVQLADRGSFRLFQDRGGRPGNHALAATPVHRLQRRRLRLGARGWRRFSGLWPPARAAGAPSAR